MTKNRIRVRAVSVKGSLHSQKGLICQDYCKHFTGKNKFIGVISDGAGSAKHGKIGARIVCDTVVDLLARATMPQAKNHVKKAIKVAREKLILHRLNKSKSEESIHDFAATVVGVFYHNNRGFFFHIGDGAALALKDDDWEDFIVSKPENGNFICETFFYTMSDWERSLRFMSFEDVNSIFLMSDGLTGFAFSNDFNAIERGFISPIHNFLCKEKTKVKALRALNNTLNNEKAQKINPDDKTLLWARF